MHPLAPKLSEVSDQDIEKKIDDLNQKYYQALRFSPSIVSQIVLLLDSYKFEQQERALAKSKKALEDGENNINDLIKIN